MTDSRQLETLAKGIGAQLSSEAAEQLLAYLDAMLRENLHINLTAVREREAAVMLHALDSLALGCGGLDEAPRMALDLGTGNGFPGVAIACLYPQAQVLLLDRRLKKLKAIERAIGAAGLGCLQLEILQADAAELPARGYERRFDLITARAVGPPMEMGRLAAPLLARGGRLLTWLSEETEAPPELRGGLRRLGAVDYTLPAPANRHRRLVHYGHPARARRS